MFVIQAKAPFRPSASTCVASNQTNVKDRKHSHRPSTNLHTSDERCQFKLYIYIYIYIYIELLINNNKWPKCSCHYQTPSPDNTCANDIIDTAMT